MIHPLKYLQLPKMLQFKLPRPYPLLHHLKNNQKHGTKQMFMGRHMKRLLKAKVMGGGKMNTVNGGKNQKMVLGGINQQMENGIN